MSLGAVAPDGPDQPTTAGPEAPPSLLPAGVNGNQGPELIDDPDMTRLAPPRRTTADSGHIEPSGPAPRQPVEYKTEVATDVALPPVLGESYYLPRAAPSAPGRPPEQPAALLPSFRPPASGPLPGQLVPQLVRPLRPAFGISISGLANLFVSMAAYFIGAYARNYYTSYYWRYVPDEFIYRFQFWGWVSIVFALFAGGLGIGAVAASKKYTPSVVIGVICIVGFLLFLILATTLVASSSPWEYYW